MEIRRIRIKEQKTGGWLASGGLYNRSTRYLTAAAAEKGVRRRTRKLAQEGVSTICIVEWEPTTHVGTIVVKAITGSR